MATLEKITDKFRAPKQREDVDYDQLVGDLASGKDLNEQVAADVLAECRRTLDELSADPVSSDQRGQDDARPDRHLDGRGESTVCPRSNSWEARRRSGRTLLPTRESVEPNFAGIS